MEILVNVVVYLCNMSQFLVLLVCITFRIMGTKSWLFVVDLKLSLSWNGVKRNWNADPNVDIWAWNFFSVESLFDPAVVGSKSVTRISRPRFCFLS